MYAAANTITFRQRTRTTHCEHTSQQQLQTRRKSQRETRARLTVPDRSRLGPSVVLFRFTARRAGVSWFNVPRRSLVLRVVVLESSVWTGLTQSLFLIKCRWSENPPPHHSSHLSLCLCPFVHTVSPPGSLSSPVLTWLTGFMQINSFHKRH